MTTHAICEQMSWFEQHVRFQAEAVFLNACLCMKWFIRRTRHDALLDRCLGGVERVGHPILLLADLHLAAAAHLQCIDRNRCAMAMQEFFCCLRFPPKQPKPF